MCKGNFLAMTPLKALSRSVSRFVAIFRFRFFIPLDTLHQKYLITIKFQSTIYIEILGFAALLTEAVLGLPQLFRNCKRRSTKGMRLGLDIDVPCFCWRFSVLFVSQIFNSYSSACLQLCSTYPTVAAVYAKIG